jgi:transposase InsO family protein
MSGLPRPRRRKPGLLGVDTPADLIQRRFTADGPNELWFTDITEGGFNWSSQHPDLGGVRHGDGGLEQEDQ